MAPMPELNIRGNTFVLTGRMWKDRGLIHQCITGMGGQVSKTMKPGCILVMASASLVRNAETGKWSPHGQATTKVNAAMEMGAVVYHEKMLRDALSSRDGIARATRVGGFGATDSATVPRTREAQAPEWTDDMQVRLDKNLAETAELLSGF